MTVNFNFSTSDYVVPDSTMVNFDFGETNIGTKLLIDNSWRNVNQIKILVSSEWKTISTVQIVVNGEWKILS